LAQAQNPLPKTTSFPFFCLPQRELRVQEAVFAWKQQEQVGF